MCDCQSQAEEPNMYFPEVGVGIWGNLLFLPPSPCPTWPVIPAECWTPGWPRPWRSVPAWGRFLPLWLLVCPGIKALLFLGIRAAGVDGFSFSLSPGSGVD